MHYTEAKALLDKIQGATFAAMDTVTIPVLKGGKANPMQGKIEKRCTGHRVMLFTNQRSNAYANKVRRHLEAEGLNPDSFQLGPLPWGERVPESPFIECKGRHYLQVVFKEAGCVEYVATESFNDGSNQWNKGDRIPLAFVIGLNERTGSEHQGLERDKQVIVRTFALDSIVALRAFNEELV